MSIALMTLAWKAKMPSGRKLVLLALCDNANDQGECFPSIQTIADKCSMGERAVQLHLAALETEGVVIRKMRHGRSTIYHIDPRRICTPADFAPPQILHHTPAESAPHPLRNLHPTPADFAPITINEPSIEPSGNQKQKRSKAAPSAFDALDFLLIAGVEEQIASDWLTVRKGKKSPATRTAIEAVLEKISEAGMTANAGLRICCERGWAGFNKEWLPQKAQARQPTQYQTKQDQTRAFVNALTGNHHDQRTSSADIIDVTAFPVAD